MKTLALLFVFIFCCNLAGAADGSFLNTQCMNYDGDLSSEQDAWCLAYITGFVEGAATDRQAEREQANRFCLDSNVTFNQIILVVKKYLKQNPELLNYPERYVVNDALASKYPCVKDPTVSTQE